MNSILRRVFRRFFPRREPPVPGLELYLSSVAGKSGLEIGGPSAAFRPRNVMPIYDRLGALDNCDFSANTTWAHHSREFVFSPHQPPGKSFFCEGSELTPIADDSYDFLLSCHNLEHFANPIKALREWQRVLRPGGTLILILPYFRFTFDHRRALTLVEHMLQDYDQGTAEDDLTHLPEILDRHDLTRDPLAGDLDNFKQRSLDNFNNRCLHHHVFDEHNSRDLLTAAGFEVVSVEVVAPIHLCILAHSKSS